MSVFLRGKKYWFKFKWMGRLIRRPAKTRSITVARQAEHNYRRDLEKKFNGIAKDDRARRVQTIAVSVKAFLEDHQKHVEARTYSADDHFLRHVLRHMGDMMRIEIGAETIRAYQNARIGERVEGNRGASGKSINEEVRLFLQVLGEDGDAIRLQLKREGRLEVKEGKKKGKALTVEELGKFLAAAKVGGGMPETGKYRTLKATRSPMVFPYVVLGFNTGMRDKTMRVLQWAQLDFLKRIITVGDDKTEAGEGRTIPMNDALYDAMVEYRAWYAENVATVAPTLYVFPYGANQKYDPARPIGSFKTVWKNLKRRTGIELRIHDMRHTLATNLGENPEVSVETLLSIAGWVSPEMLKNYVHIRTEAKRKALASLPNPVPVQGEVVQIKSGTNK